MAGDELSSTSTWNYILFLRSGHRKYIQIDSNNFIFLTVLGVRLAQETGRIWTSFVHKFRANAYTFFFHMFIKNGMQKAKNSWIHRYNPQKIVCVNLCLYLCLWLCSFVIVIWFRDYVIIYDFVHQFQLYLRFRSLYWLTVWLLQVYVNAAFMLESLFRKLRSNIQHYKY